jgi:hypothetical protein
MKKKNKNNENEGRRKNQHKYPLICSVYLIIETDTNKLYETTVVLYNVIRLS